MLFHKISCFFLLQKRNTCVIFYYHMCVCGFENAFNFYFFDRNLHSNLNTKLGIWGANEQINLVFDPVQIIFQRRTIIVVVSGLKWNKIFFVCREKLFNQIWQIHILWFSNFARKKHLLFFQIRQLTAVALQLLWQKIFLFGSNVNCELTFQTKCLNIYI